MTYKLFIIIGIILISNFEDATAQEKESYIFSYNRHGIDTIIQVELPPITVISVKKRPRFYRNLTRLKKAIIICYPVAKQAEIELYEMRREIEFMDSEKDIKRYISSVEDKLKDLYTPILKKMTFYQGAILLKLIDRQTGESGYELLKELKSGFSAFFWQAMARLYGANLKLKYDPDGDDFIMEQLVLHYEQEYGIVPILYRDKKKEII